MKRMFIAAMAIAALVSCSKEEEVSYADSMSKTIQISILNETEGTRAEGGDTATGTHGAAVATNESLKVLFAKADGTILFEDGLTSTGSTDDTHKGEVGAAGEEELYVKDESTGKYMWHNVPAEVKKIAVVRYEETDFPQGVVGKDLETDLEAAAKNEAKNLARPVEQIILYGVDDLYDTGDTHRVGNTFFHVWQADVEVAPKVARLEVHNIECTDLGALNADGHPDTYDIDELLLKTLTWTGAEEEHSAPGFGEQRLYGEYNPASAAKDPNTQTDAEQRSNSYAPANGAWSWNVAPCTFTGMKLDMDAFAYDYIIASRNLPLTVTDLATDEAKKNIDNTLEAGKIYTLDLTFNQSNIKTEDGICVVVTVDVAKWVVEKRFPVYSMGN